MYITFPRPLAHADGDRGLRLAAALVLDDLVPLLADLCAGRSAPRSKQLVTTAAPTISGMSHLAINTADLARYRRFYEDLLGLRLGVIVRMDHPPYLRHAIFHVDDILVLHVFEVPGYDPEAQGIGTNIGERGRLDHFGLMVRDESALRAVAERLRAAGATDGEVRALGPVLSVHVTDPDGLQLEVNCPNLHFDPASGGGKVEEVGMPDWDKRLQAAVLERP